VLLFSETSRTFWRRYGIGVEFFWLNLYRSTAHRWLNISVQQVWLLISLIYRAGVLVFHGVLLLSSRSECCHEAKPASHLLAVELGQSTCRETHKHDLITSLGTVDEAIIIMTTMMMMMMMTIMKTIITTISIIVRPHRYVKHKMRPIVTDVPWSMCLSVGHNRELCQNG